MILKDFYNIRVLLWLPLQWLMVSFEDGEDLRVCISDLNESLQATVERQHPMPHVSESVSIPFTLFQSLLSLPAKYCMSL